MNNLQNILGLNAREQRVCDALETNPKIVAEIAHDTGLPRTSVDAIVARLTARGILKKQKREKHIYYRRNLDRALLQMLFPQSPLPMGKYTIPLLEKAGILVHSGQDALVKLYESLYTHVTKKRVYGIQPTASALHILKKVPRDTVQHINKTISESNVVNEVILEENYFLEIRNQIPQQFDSWLNTFRSRATITYIVPTGSLSFHSELIICDKTAVLVDWQNCVAIEIVHSEMVSMLHDLYKSFQDNGTRVEYNDLFIQ